MNTLQDYKLNMTINDLLNSFSEPFIITDLDFRIIHSNDRARHFLNVNTNIQTIQDQVITDFLAFIDADTPENIRRLNTGHSYFFEEILTNLQNEEIRIGIRVSRLESKGELYLSWYFLDYTKEHENRQEMIDFMAELNSKNRQLAEYTEQLGIYRQIFDSLHHSLIVTNGHLVTEINSSARNLFGFSDKQIMIDQILNAISHDQGLQKPSLLNTDFTPITHQDILILDEAETRQTRCLLSISPISRNDSGQNILVWDLIEISDEVNNQQSLIDLSTELNHLLKEIQIKNQAILSLSRTDGLTGINNRTYLIELIEKSMKEAGNLGVIIFDIDNFKQFNDTYGHLCGDMILKTIADASRKLTGADNEIGRYGGEEFLIMMPESDKEQTVEMAEQLRKMIENTTMIFEGQNVSLTVSLGSSIWNQKESIDKLISRADKALYISKNEGKNRTTHL